MDFSKLSSNEKLAVYGAAAVIIGGLVGFGTNGLGILAVIAAIGLLAVVFLPQLSPSTTLPGSRGSLMVALGGLAAAVLVLGLLSRLSIIGFMLANAALPTLFYLIAIGGGVVMAWAGWREFQAEGGKFQIGTSTSPSSTTRAPAASHPNADASTTTPEATSRNPDDRPPT